MHQKMLAGWRDTLASLSSLALPYGFCIRYVSQHLQLKIELYYCSGVDNRGFRGFPGSKLDLYFPVNVYICFQIDTVFVSLVCPGIPICCCVEWNISETERMWYKWNWGYVTSEVCLNLIYQFERKFTLFIDKWNRKFYLKWLNFTYKSSMLSFVFVYRDFLLFSL